MRQSSLKSASTVVPVFSQYLRTTGSPVRRSTARMTADFNTAVLGDDRNVSSSSKRCSRVSGCRFAFVGGMDFPRNRGDAGKAARPSRLWPNQARKEGTRSLFLVLFAIGIVLF